MSICRLVTEITQHDWLGNCLLEKGEDFMKKARSLSTGLLFRSPAGQAERAHAAAKLSGAGEPVTAGTGFYPASNTDGNQTDYRSR